MRIQMLAARRKEGRLSIPYLAFLVFESAVKGLMFDCRMCGQCILSYTGFACPMRCPKKLRNGPCGGTRPGGFCEVYEDMECAWYRIYKRSNALHMEDRLEMLQPPVDWRLEGTASWLNHLSGADSHIKPEKLKVESRDKGQGLSKAE